MKVIGLIGGMSWESSAEYYSLINQGVRNRLGPTASARCLLWSFNFADIEELQHRGDWQALTERMIDAAQRLEAGGAEALLICTNTMHMMAAEVEAAVNVPLIHIADPTAERIQAAGFSRVGLLGTVFTMEQAFYRSRLAEQHGLDVVVPDEADRASVHRIIYEELVAGKVLPRSRQAFRAIIDRLVEDGAQAVILGCTEIMLLVREEDSLVPIFDTTAIHAAAAVERALGTPLRIEPSQPSAPAAGDTDKSARRMDIDRDSTSADEQGRPRRRRSPIDQLEKVRNEHHHRGERKSTRGSGST